MHVLIRRCRTLLLPVLLSLPLLTAPAPAREVTTGAAATEADMNFYAKLAALNVCISRAAGVEFKKAVPIAAETIAQVLKGKHGSMIKALGSKVLTLQQLRSGSAESAVVGAVQMCPKQVPADVVVNVKKLMQKKAPGAGGALGAPTAPR